MSAPVKRQYEDVAAAGTGKVADGKHGPAVMMEASAFGGGEARPAKVARHNDRVAEGAGEKAELFGGAYKHGGAMEVAVGEGNSAKESLLAHGLKIKVRDFGSAEGKSDRDPARVDLERKASDAAKESSGNKEKAEDHVAPQQQSGWDVGQELADGNRGDGNPEGLRKKSPREGEGKTVVDVKREEPREKDKEKEVKEEKRIERKEDVVLVMQHQLPPQPLLHLDVKSEKDNEKDEREREKGEREREKSEREREKSEREREKSERERERDRERDREKGEKEKERLRERERERERSRDREKEAVRLEKREKREKDRDRDSHRRDDGRVEKVEKEEGKGVKIEEPEVDRKPVREVDDRKVVEKEGRDRVRERERDKDRDEEGEGEKRKKRVREPEKDRDMDSEGTSGEKDKDAAHGYGVQQRKRMLRPRGPTHPANRDSRSRFRPKDNEGTQGRPESSFISYKVGNGMPELAKLWKEYDFGERNSLSNGSGPTVEIRIPAELATTTNRQIRGSQLWGTDIYTDDSDIVAVLLHTGYYSPSATPPPNSISELRATIRILGPQEMYTSTLRNGLRSRAWGGGGGGGGGCSYSVERCRIMKQGGGFVELEPCLNRTPQVSPTLAPAASERTVTTRAASSSAYRQQRFMQEVTIQYNLCNEPWAKYSMSIVADRGLKKSQFTSARLKKGEVLYVETHTHRYELAYDGDRATCNGASTATSSFPHGASGVEKGKEKWGSTERASAVSEKEPISHNHNGEKSHGNHPSNGQTAGHHGHAVTLHHSEPHEYYRWSKCRRPLPLSSMQKKGVPLPAEFVHVLEEGLAWEEVLWSPTSVWVRGTEYMLNRAQFFSFDKIVTEE